MRPVGLIIVFLSCNLNGTIGSMDSFALLANITICVKVAGTFEEVETRCENDSQSKIMVTGD